MTTTPQHTPTPWTVLYDDYTGERFLSAGGFAVPSEPFRDSDLDFIIRAVNAYEPMREALTDLLAEIGPNTYTGSNVAVTRARAALARAEKE